jgi:hypothetical protein
LYNVVDANENRDTLKILCERVVAYNAYERAIPFLDLVQTDQGFGVVSNEKLLPASRERVDTLINATKAEQNKGIENLILYLENNATYWDDWKSSQTYSLLSDVLITTLKQFQLYAPWGDQVDGIYPKCRRDFIKFHPNLRKAQYDLIAPYTSQEYLDLLIEQMRDGELTTENKKVLEPLRFSLCLYSIGIKSQADNYVRNAVGIMKKNPAAYPVWRDSAEGQYILDDKPQHEDTPIFCGSSLGARSTLWK